MVSLQKVYSKSFFKEMRRVKKRIEEERNVQAGRLYVKVEKFVLNCSYSSYKYAKTLVKLFLEGRSEKEISEVMGISEVTVRYHELTSLSNKLYSIYGKDFFNLMKDFYENKEELRRRVLYVDCVEKNKYDYCVSNVISEAKEDYSDLCLSTYDIKDCSKELDFILKYSIKSIKEEMKQLDKDKLNYLLSVIDGEAGSVTDRCNLIFRLEEL